MTPYNQLYNPYQPYAPNYLQSSSENNGIIWVQGESGAKAFPVQNGKSVVLFDAEAEQFFIKTTDMSGMPQPLRRFSYSEVSETAQKKESVDTSKFITREEFEEVIAGLKNKQQYQPRKDVIKNGKQTVQ